MQIYVTSARLASIHTLRAPGSEARCYIRCGLPTKASLTPERRQVGLLAFIAALLSYKRAPNQGIPYLNDARSASMRS